MNLRLRRFDSWGPHNERGTTMPGGIAARQVTPGVNPGFLSTWLGG
jgi:hypothetical protein